MGGKRRAPGRRRFPAKPGPDVRQHLRDLYGPRPEREGERLGPQKPRPQ